MKIKVGCMAVAMLLAGCSTNDPWGDWENMNGGGIPGGGGNIMGGGSMNDTSGDDLETFGVEFDDTPLAETETVPADDEDFVENSDFAATLTIAYADGKATVTGSADGVTVTQNGAHVTVNSTVKGVEYVLKGYASDGSFKVYSEKKFKLTLNGVSLTNPQGAAINIQSGKRVFVVCADGTTNSLADGSSYTKTEGEDMKGCFFSEGQLIFSGKGTLDVTGKYKHGICSDDYIRFRPGCNIAIDASVGNGVKTNDAIILNGGVLNVNVTGAASKGLSTDGYMVVSGGRATVITSGGGEYDADEEDVSACAGIKCDSTFTMTGGTLHLKSTGAGGKGLSCDRTVTIDGGNINIITTGKTYAYSSQLDALPKGIKADGDLMINGGHLKVRTSGGEGSEGIESKAAMTIAGGTVEVSSYDDCLNASTALNISGGNVYCYSSGNDGIDSNGTLTVSGGVVVTSGTSQPEEGMDVDSSSRFVIKGGTIVSIGGTAVSPNTSSSTQPTLVYGGSASAGATVNLADNDGKSILSYVIPRTYNSMGLLITSPSMSKGETYTLNCGGTISGGTTFHQLTTGGSYTDGSQLTSFTVSSMVTSIGTTGGGMGGGGGNRPGGW